MRNNTTRIGMVYMSKRQQTEMKMSAGLKYFGVITALIL